MVNTQIRNLVEQMTRPQLPQAYGNFFKGKHGRFISPNPRFVPKSQVGKACAIGQVAYSLNLDPSNIEGVLDSVDVGTISCKSHGRWGGNLGSFVEHLNDVHKMPVQEIGTVLLQKIPQEELDRFVNVKTWGVERYAKN